MTGLRRRVSFGFMSIVVVLVFSGAISYIELSTLSADTDNILGTNRQYKTLAADMYKALRDHNNAFVQMTAFGDRDKDFLCEESLGRLDQTLIQARSQFLVPEIIDSMMVTSAAIRDVSMRFMTAPKYNSEYDILKSEFPRLDSLSKGFSRRLYQEYQPLYEKMSYAIDYYELESQNSLTPGAEQLHNNAYRAVTPVLISLIVMIAIVLMLYYFMLTYCVSPIVKINKALKDYISYKIPFAPKSAQWRDEMQELCERIEVLIKQSKISNKE